DHLVAMPFDEVRLEDETFALQRYRGAEELVLLVQDAGEGHVIALRLHDVHGGVGRERAEHADEIARGTAKPSADAGQGAGSVGSWGVGGGCSCGAGSFGDAVIAGAWLGGSLARPDASVGKLEEVALSDAECEGDQRLPIAVRLQPTRLPQLLLRREDVA